MIANWRDNILREFTPKLARLTLVADPDGLLLEEGVVEGLRAKGFELIPFEDHVAFRYAYESRFRSRWDRGEDTDLVVVLRSASAKLDALPYDLLQAGRKLSFNLGELFPNLSYRVVAELDRADLDALFDAHVRHAVEPLGENATKDFILRHVFEIAPELIKTPADLLRALLRRHYRGQRIPPLLEERLIQQWKQNDLFREWPLDQIVPDRERFFAFLQERWPVFLDALAKSKGEAVQEDAARYTLRFPGPALLPFDDDDVRVYVDNLFLEGFLQPVGHQHAHALSKTWAAYGVRVSLEANRRRRLEGLLETVQETLPALEARCGDWVRFAYRWAQLKLLEAEDRLRMSNETDHLRQRLEALVPQVDARFLEWVLRHYASLVNLPPINPAMLHHLPRFFARSLLDRQSASLQPSNKVAFLMVDGLALDQWIAIREVLQDQNARLRFQESAVFAWIPTITSVSRQAAFAGKPPIFFPASISTTEKEPDLWRQFWVDQGLHPGEVAYAKGLGERGLEDLAELVSQPRLRVVGLVIDKVDRIMHGMQLGTAGMHNQVRQWASEGFVCALIELLQSQRFQIYLASDHGNIEAKGIGKPLEGAVADLRGERVRVYSDRRLRSQIKERFPEALEWPPVGLPEDYLALIAPPRAAFVQAGETIVGHGGISVEELLVPFVRIERKDL
jgi:hypothetical protein